MGKPIITTNVEGCKDVVDDGVNGYLCKVRDYNDLAKKMNNLLALDSKDFERMGLQSRKKMELEFDEKIVIAKYINLVNNTVHH